MRSVFFCLLFILLFCPGPARSEDAKNFTFAVTACAHIGVCDPDNFEVVANKIKPSKPDFAVFLGGMINPTINAPAEALWRNYDRICASMDTRIFHLHGNCQLDAFEPMTNQEEKDKNERCWQQRYQKRYFTFIYRNNLFIFLDSDALIEELSGEPARSEQLDFLKKSLSGGSGYRNIFLMMHKSLWSMFEDKWFSLIHPLIKDKVNYVFGANTDVTDLKTVDNVAYLSLGFISLNNNLFKPYYPQFMLVEVDDDSVMIQETFPMSFSENRSPIVQHHILSPADRSAILVPEKVIGAMRIKPGMTIADIGAGEGYFTFPFSDALRGTGKVFATDIDPRMVRILTEKAREKKSVNVFPAQVKPGIVDDSYKKQAFDIMFFCEVYQYIKNPKEYFADLRRFLIPGSGRLYIVTFKNAPALGEMEFGDFSYVLKFLKAGAENFPIFKRLDPDIQRFITEWAGGDIPADIREKMVQNLNRMLEDRFLFNEIIDYYYNNMKNLLVEPEWAALLKQIIYPANSYPLVKYLEVKLDSRGVFSRSRKNISDGDKKELFLLNRRLITSVFKSLKVAYMQSASTYPEKESIIETLRGAGYQLVKAHDILAYYDILEFKR